MRTPEAIASPAPPLVIAIDGPAASGKSTVARRVAAALGCVYVDSGAVYRGVTWAALRRGVGTQDEPAVVRMLEELRLDVILDGNAVGMRYEGADPGQEIRGPDVTAHVSFIAAMPAVRARVTQCLREMTRFGRLVMEGRDIGSVVFPESPHRFYLDASPEERARRRHLETAGQESESAVRAESERLRRRDAIDSSRQAAPLRVAPGAVVVDSTGMNIDQVVAFILQRLAAQGVAAHS